MCQQKPWCHIYNVWALSSCLLQVSYLTLWKKQFIRKSPYATQQWQVPALPREQNTYLLFTTRVLGQKVFHHHLLLQYLSRYFSFLTRELVREFSIFTPNCYNLWGRAASWEVLGAPGRGCFICLGWSTSRIALDSTLASWKKKTPKCLWFLCIYSYSFTVILQPYSKCFRTGPACCILDECPRVNSDPLFSFIGENPQWTQLMNQRLYFGLKRLFFLQEKTGSYDFFRVFLNDPSQKHKQKSSREYLQIT